MRIKTLMMGEEAARDVPDSELEDIPIPSGMTAGESHCSPASSLPISASARSFALRAWPRLTYRTLLFVCLSACLLAHLAEA